MIRYNSPALWLAGSLSLALSVAAGVSGWQRGGNALESTLWAGLSVLAVLVVHVLPALLYRRGWLALLAFPVWLGVFAVVAFSHAQFFTLAEIHAGRERVLSFEQTPIDPLGPAPGRSATNSGGLLSFRHTPLASPPLVVEGLLKTEDTPIDPPKTGGVPKNGEAIKTGGVTPGRTAASVARDLAKATAALVWLPQAKRPAQQQAVDALRLELAAVQQAEAREAASLASQRASIEARQADPVGLRLGQVLGLSVDSVMLAVALETALVLELASVILWRLALVTSIEMSIAGHSLSIASIQLASGRREGKAGVIALQETPYRRRRLLSSLSAFWKRCRTDLETTPGPDAQSGRPALQPAPEAPPVLTSDEPSDEPEKREPATSSNDAQAILALLKAKGAVSLGTLQASVSKRLRPVLADLLAALESAGQIKVTVQGRGRLVELA
jgi:hypothetical protein